MPSIGDYAFSMCQSISEIEIPESIEENAIYSCSILMILIIQVVVSNSKLKETFFQFVANLYKC